MANKLTRALRQACDGKINKDTYVIVARGDDAVIVKAVDLRDTLNVLGDNVQVGFGEKEFTQSSRGGTIARTARYLQIATDGITSQLAEVDFSASPLSRGLIRNRWVLA